MLKSVLIVDDEINLRRSLAYIIERAGYQVSMVADGAAALERIEKKTFDLIIVDLQLPDIEGIKLTSLINQVDERLPVIILTAHPIVEIEKEGKAIKVAAFLDKPIEPAEIIKKIEEVLSNAGRNV